MSKYKNAAMIETDQGHALMVHRDICVYASDRVMSLDVYNGKGKPEDKACPRCRRKIKIEASV